MADDLTYWIDTEVISSLWLQVLLYCSLLYFPVFASGLILILVEKYPFLDKDVVGLALAIVLVLVVIEPFRLYFGYVGNLSERVSRYVARLCVFL